jgi:peptide/nickel transport system ATP-binding protein
VSDRLAVMYAGKLIETGPADEVFTSPAHPYTKALAAAFPTIGDESFVQRPAGLGGDPPDPRDVPSGCPFHPRCPAAFDRCPHDEPLLAPAGPERLAACLLVNPAAAVPAETVPS